MRRPVVYIIRKRALGDVLWMEPLIRQLAAKYRRVIVFSKYNEVFDNYPIPNVVFKNNLNIFEKIIWKTESILGTRIMMINLEMEYEKHPKKHILHAYQQKAGEPTTFEYPNIYLSEAEKNKNMVPAEKYAVLHLETASVKNFRRIYGVDWKIIARNLHDQGFKVYQVGNNPEPVEGVSFIKTNIRELIILISKSTVFIGLDSGPSHIAASLGIPSLIFFGAVNPAYRHFMDKLKVKIMQQFCEYAGCYHEALNSVDGVKCRWVGDEGIPKCSVHSNADVIFNINKLLGTYDINEESKKEN